MNELGELEVAFTNLYHELDKSMSTHIEACRKTGVFYEDSVLYIVNPNLHTLKENTTNALNKLIQFCLENEIHSFFCNLETFIKTYERKLQEFISQNKDSIELDYIENEISFYSNALNDFQLVSEHLHYSFKRKLEFLDFRRKKDLDSLHSTEKRSPLTNLEAVFLLKQLGILKHLTENGYPQTKIAEIIGKILGKNPQGSRELLGKIEFPEKFGQKQQSDFQNIDDFLNSL